MTTTIIILAAIFFIVLVIFLARRGPKPEKVDHPFFDRLWLWPENQHTRWEAEKDFEAEYFCATVGMHAEDNYESESEPAPTDRELAFCKQILADPQSLFMRCRVALEKGWREWFQESPPDDLMSQFKLEGFGVPVAGNEERRWSVVYFCDKAAHYFCIAFDGGSAQLETIDG